MTSPLLDRAGAVAADPLGSDAGVVWHYGDPFGEQRALAVGQGIVDQSHLGVVQVSGPDRLTWLNDLTSQNLLGLEPGDSTELLVFSPQGHIEHAAAVLDDGEATWLLTELAPRLAAWLESMRFTRCVDVVDVTAQWAVLGTTTPIEAVLADGVGLCWTDPWPQVLDRGTRYGPPAESHPGRDWNWHLLLAPRPALVETVAAFEAAGVRLVGTWALTALRIAAWRPRFVSEVDHRTLGHELDWLRTAVHLKKGCYRGQETVARVHNLGHPPRRLTFLHLDGSTADLPPAGARVTAEGCEVGRVTSAAQHYELGPVALAVIKRQVPVDMPLQVEWNTVAEARPALQSLTTGQPSAIVAATQTEIVPVAGVSVDRPAAHSPLMPGLRMPGAKSGGIQVFS